MLTGDSINAESLDASEESESEAVEKDIEQASISEVDDDDKHGVLRTVETPENISVDEEVAEVVNQDVQQELYNSEENVVVSSIHFEESEESSEESETTSPVSIHNMPLISIVEEDDFNSVGVSEESEEESEDEAGVSLSFLMDSAEPAVSSDQFNQVFEQEDSSQNLIASGHTESGFVATLSPDTSSMAGDTLMLKNPWQTLNFLPLKKCAHKIKPLLVM